MSRPTVRVMALPHCPVGPEVWVPSPGNAGIDLYAAESVTLFPGERKLVPTGLCVAMPEGMEAQVRPRSGRALKEGLSVTNSPGTVDSSYRGEIAVIAENRAPVSPTALIVGLLEAIRDEADGVVQRLLDEQMIWLAHNTIRINKGERFAQLVFARHDTPILDWVNTLDMTERGAQGFGHSGN